MPDIVLRSSTIADGSGKRICRLAAIRSGRLVDPDG
jgi:hypothetical protein